MLWLFLASLAVFLLLVAGELLWRKRDPNPEITRKFVHITVGSFVAAWPYFLSWNQIKILSAAFIVVVAVSIRFKIFKAIHSVQRPTRGDLFFALIVGILAFIVPSEHKGIYTAAILQMSLADGFAAILGTRYGKNNQYDIFFSYPKSWVGTVTFFAFSLAILLGYVWFTGARMASWYVISIAAGATLLENVFIYGTDNLVVPLFVAGMLLL